MYLSRIRLNESQRETIRAFSSPHILHGAIEQAFSGERQRNLWRIDYLNGDYYLLILVLSSLTDNISNSSDILRTTLYGRQKTIANFLIS